MINPPTFPFPIILKNIDHVLRNAGSHYMAVLCTILLIPISISKCFARKPKNLSRLGGKKGRVRYTDLGKGNPEGNKSVTFSF